MDLSNNYYQILGINHQATEKEIKLSYYDKSKTMHPDKGGNQDEFKLISEAYKVLTSKDLRPEYDKRSKFGKNYDELWDLLKFEFSNANKVYDKDALDKFKKNEILDIVYKIDSTFNGNIEYERWITCKTCNGTGGVDGKFAIKDATGKVITNLQTGDECDFCEGTGKREWDGQDCAFCNGKGKFSSVSCGACKGEKRILHTERFKISPSKITTDKYKVDFRGNQSKDGKVGNLWLIRKTE
jgi:molecular chaperone DnaJ